MTSYGIPEKFLLIVTNMHILENKKIFPFTFHLYIKNAANDLITFDKNFLNTFIYERAELPNI